MGSDDDRSQHSGAEGFATETPRPRMGNPLTSRPPPPGSATATAGKRVQAIIGVTVGFLLAVILALVIVFVTRSGKEGTPASTSAATATSPEPTAEAPVAAPTTTVAAAPASAPLPTTGADGDALRALEKLRTGIVDCAKRIGNLPGTSKTVPASLSLVSKGPYTPRPGDFGSPSFQCSQYKLAEPMTFVVQWQYFGGGVGKGVAWIDADADGKADRAWGFDAKVEDKGLATPGEIKAIDAATKPETPR